MRDPPPLCFGAASAWPGRGPRNGARGIVTRELRKTDTDRNFVFCPPASTGRCAGEGTYDFKANDLRNENTYYINGRKVRNDEFGNYLAGYAAGYAWSESGDPTFMFGVHAAGSWYGLQESRDRGAPGTLYGIKRSQLLFSGDDWGSVVMIRNGQIDGITDSLFAQ